MQLIKDKEQKIINFWFTLQTITCHIVRLKLIEHILDDYKVAGDTIDQRTLSLSVGKLVEYYFKCIPSNSLDNDDVEDEEDTTKDVARDLECEELVMLLLYLMQSYLWTTNGTYLLGFHHELKELKKERKKKMVSIMKLKMVGGKCT